MSNFITTLIYNYVVPLQGLNAFKNTFSSQINYGGSASYPVITKWTAKANSFLPDNQGYHKLKIDIAGQDIPEQSIGGGSTLIANLSSVSIAICTTTPTESNLPNFSYVSTNNYITTDTHAGDTQWFAAELVWRNPRNEDTFTLYVAFKVLMPTLQQISKISMDYNSIYRLTESGSAPISLVVTNPFPFSIVGKFDTDDTYSISTNLTTATANYSFTASDIGNKVYTITLRSASSGADNTVYYFYDDFNAYHAVYKSYASIESREGVVISYSNPYTYIENTTIEYNISIVDNSNIFSLVSASVASVRSASPHAAISYYLTETGAIKLDYSFKYTALGTNTYNIKLYNSASQSESTYINTTITKTSPGTYSGTLYSDTLTRVETAHLVLEITDSFNRILIEDFGAISIRAYDRPKISYLDIYYSKENGTLDIQSTHVSALANYTWSSLDNTNTLTQQMTVVNNTTHTTIATINPALTSGTRKYLSSLTLPLGADYTITFTISDSLGNSSSLSFVLTRTGNVLMDFNNTGFGMAIGKVSEANSLEINLPTIFYNTVDYIDGTRQTSDAASVLGYMDTYNTGNTTIQDILDYLVNKVLNG